MKEEFVKIVINASLISVDDIITLQCSLLKSPKNARGWIFDFKSKKINQISRVQSQSLLEKLSQIQITQIQVQRLPQNKHFLFKACIRYFLFFHQMKVLQKL